MTYARFLQFAVFSAFLAVIAAPAHAQNNKPIVSENFYEDRASGGTNTAASLTLTFAQSPTGKFLNITNVSCNIILGANQILVGVNLYVGTASGQNDLGRPYSIKGNVIPESANGTAKFYSIVTNQVFYKMGPGRFPSIDFFTTISSPSQLQANCVLVGNLTDS